MRTKTFNPYVSGVITIVVVMVVFVAVIISGIPGGPTLPLVSGHPTLIKVRLADADALAPHASVQIAGVKIGEVRKVESAGDQAIVTMAIEPQYADLHSDAQAVLRPHGLFGPKYIELSPGSSVAAPLTDGQEIPVANTTQPVDLDQVLHALQAKERTQVKTALVELGKAAAGRGTDVNQLVGAASTLTANLDPTLQTLNPHTGNLSDALVQNEAFNASFAQAPLDKLVASSNRTLAAFAKSSQQLQDLLVHADSALTTLDRTLNGESSNIHQLLQLAPPTIDKLDRFNDLLSVFALNLTGKENGFTDVRSGLKFAILNPESAFSSYDTCNPLVDQKASPTCDPVPNDPDPTHGRRYYVRVQTFNLGGGPGLPSGIISTLCGTPVAGAPVIGPLLCGPSGAAFQPGGGAAQTTTVVPNAGMGAQLSLFGSLLSP